MAGIRWNVSSINSFFRTSLNQSSSGTMSGIYNSLNEAAMIKNGGYSKLMKSYYAELKKQQSTEKKDNVDQAKDNKDKTDKIKTDKDKNIEKKDTTYNKDGLKKESVSSILNELI